MPEFPLREDEIVHLARSMHAGYVDHPSYFPGADVAGLDAELAAFESATEDYERQQALASIAAKEKAQRLKTLKAFMRTQLKQSEADAAPNPALLEFIGWAPRGKGRDVELPGQPMGLKADVRDAGVLRLTWKKPSRGSGGRVRSYIIQRRESQDHSAFTAWHLAGQAFEKHIELLDEPRGQRLEYCIVAANPSGQSAPSQIVAVML
ncbi:MAG TPA: fibronectin type III domain-containing protein [Candidatus Bathyarchaeia archaeon]|nr:fibronectin type III domain-containing protein [Candidatus Bathyarchaeia archaeon]